MKNVLFKGIAVAVAATALGTAGTVGTASAATHSHSQVRVCNTNASVTLKFTITGQNDAHEDLVHTSIFTAGPGSCVSVANQWWYRFTVSYGKKPPFGVHKTQDAPRNRGWVTVNINYPR